MLWMGQGALQW